MPITITKLVTNFPETERSHFERAINMFEEIYEDCAGAFVIKDDAYDFYGNRLPGDNALHVIAECAGSLNNFWDVYRSLAG